ncbi:MAG: hypothetical protein AB1502_03025 [Thermodesulfobacteriota bacterium]
MKPRLYELNWHVETDAHSFLYREFKVLDEREKVRKYGKKREAELNEGMSINERSNDGFYYRYLGAHRVKDIDGFLIDLKYK